VFCLHGAWVGLALLGVVAVGCWTIQSQTTNIIASIISNSTNIDSLLDHLLSALVAR
jgi:hypothetical protein